MNTELNYNSVLQQDCLKHSGQITAVNNNIVYLFFKRMLDITCSAVGIIVLSPLMIITAIMIKLDSKGSALFKQERCGKGGQSFNMLKFRSMVCNAEELLKELKDKNEQAGPVFKIRNDPRITRVGKIIRRTSIDELPQLFNIIKGDMSIVGPRPPLPREVEHYTEYQRQRLLVKPGLTCFWQVMGRNSIEFDVWVELDIKYIKERNFRLDLLLILKTFWVLVGDENAS